MIVDATGRDRPEFLRLWSEFMAEERKGGSRTHASRQNLYLYLGFYESYLAGCLFGFTLFEQTPSGEKVGVLMIGEASEATAWETDFGKMAILWGVYVQPTYRKHGVASGLFREGAKRSRELGFQTVESYIRSDNKWIQRLSQNGGAEFYMHRILMDLRDPKLTQGLQGGK